MNAVHSIRNNQFLADLEQSLLTDPVSLNLTFNGFTEQLWFLVCGLDLSDRRKLAKQLGINDRRQYHNVGEIEYRVLEQLKIDWAA